MSIDVHWFNLVHGFGSVCYGGQGRRGSMLYWVVLQSQLSLGYLLHLPSFIQGLSSIGLGDSCYSTFYNTQIK